MISMVMNESKKQVVDYLISVKDSTGSAASFMVYPHTIIVPRIYGLPRIHKPLTQIR